MSNAEKKTKRMLTLAVAADGLTATYGQVPSHFLTDNFTSNGLEQPAAGGTANQVHEEMGGDNHSMSDSDPITRPAARKWKKTPRKRKNGYASRFVDTEAAHDSDPSQGKERRIDEPTLSDLEFVVHSDEETSNSDDDSTSKPKKQKRSGSELSLYRQLENREAERNERKKPVFNHPSSSQKTKQRGGKTTSGISRGGKKSDPTPKAASRGSTSKAPLLNGSSHTRVSGLRIVAEVDRASRAAELNAMPLILLEFVTSYEGCLHEMAPFHAKLKDAVDERLSRALDASRSESAGDLEIRLSPSELGAVLHFCNVGSALKKEVEGRGLMDARLGKSERYSLFDCICLHDAAAMRSVVENTLKLVIASVLSKRLPEEVERFLREQAGRFASAYDTLAHEIQSIYGGFVEKKKGDESRSFFA